MNIQIVPIAEAHVEGFRASLDAVARERNFLAQVEAKPLEEVRAFVMSSIASDAAQFVALAGSLVVGWCDIFPSWAHAVQHRGTLGMGVLAAHRGQGIGTRLVVACLEKARRQGITRVELEARADNTSAIRLYKRIGFVHEATIRLGMRIDGVYHDCVQMALVYE